MMPELLAPAGSFEALTAAAQNGADAVYLGGKSLNARAGAGNFDREELKAAADYLHERGKKLYVTVNTVVKQAELKVLYDLAEQLAYAGADAAIVQDFGVCEVLRQVLPGLKLHASTQMAISNPQGARYLKKRGFERVVLARELSAEEIARCSAEGIETEVFCHGALCVACSGLCLFSSLVGGRSGNRGACAQPCRLPYRLKGAASDAGYLLSPKDLMTAPRLDKIIAAGATSLKIEGRLKRPEYVAIVTGIYRHLLDGKPFTAEDEEALKQIFNRGGFTQGYAFGIKDGAFLSKLKPSHSGVRVGRADAKTSIRLEMDISKDDALVIGENPVKLEGFAGRTIKNPLGYTGELTRLVSAAQMTEARESYRGEHTHIPVTARLTLKTGKPCAAEVVCGDKNVTVEGQALERSQNTSLDADRLRRQFGKTGGTVYSVTDVVLDADEDAFVPMSAINALRREALERLSTLRIESARGCARELLPLPEYAVEGTARAIPRICVQSCDIELLRSLEGVDRVYFPSDTRSIPDLTGMYLYLPPVLPEAALETLNKNAAGAAGVYISNIGQADYEWKGEIRYDFALNIANEPARKFLNVGLKQYTPSVELTSREIGVLGGNKELIVYGRLPLMHLRHCPLNAARGGGLHTTCRACDQNSEGKRLNDCSLTDRMNVEFPLRRMATEEGCIIDLLNSVPVSLARHINKLPDAAAWRIIITDESAAQARKIVECYKALARGEDARLEDLPLNVTAGHMFRGVE